MKKLGEVFGVDDWFTISNIDLSHWESGLARLTFGLIAEIDGVHSQMGIRDIRIYSYSDNGAPVPEPATILLFGTGLLGIVGISRNRRKR